MTRSVPSLVIVAMLCSPGALRALGEDRGTRTDDALLIRFRTEYRSGFDAWTHRLQNVACSGRWKEFASVTPEDLARQLSSGAEHFRYFRKEGAYAYVGDHEGDWPEEQVFVYNPTYLAFRLARPPHVGQDGVKSQWRLSSVGMGRAAPDSMPPNIFFDAPIQALPQSFDWDWANSNLRLLSASEEIIGGETMFEVRYEYQDTARAGMTFEYSVALSPELDWALRRSVQTTRDQSRNGEMVTVRYKTVEYDRANADEIFPRTVTVLTTVQRDGEVVSNKGVRVEFSDMAYGSVKESAFVPQAFGVDGVSLFRFAYPDAMAHLRRSLENIECRGGWTRWKRSGEGERVVDTSGQVRFCIKDDSKLAEFHLPAGRSLVLCTDRTTAFSLEKTDGAYVVRRFGSDKRTMAEISAALRSGMDRFVSAAFSLWEFPIDDILVQKNLELKEVTNPSADQSTVNLSFDLHHGGHWRRTGLVKLDPLLHWAVREFDVSAVSEREGKHNTISLAGRVDYSRRSDDVTFPGSLRVSERILANDRSEHFEWEFEADSVEVGNVTDEYFTVEAFGVPALPARAKRGYYPLNHWLFWTFAVLAIVSSIALRKAWRKS